jgi:hypothetical protein
MFCSNVNLTPPQRVQQFFPCLHLVQCLVYRNGFPYSLLRGCGSWPVSLSGNRRGPLSVIPRELQLINLLIWLTRATIVGSKAASVLRSSILGGPIAVGGPFRSRLPRAEVKPDGSKRWETSADYSKGQLDVRPEKYGSGVVNNIVRVFDVLLRNRVCGDDSGDAHGAYTRSSATVTALRWESTYAAPNVSMKMTASFFLISIFTLITMGIGRMRITISAITSVN